MPNPYEEQITNNFNIETPNTNDHSNIMKTVDPRRSVSEQNMMSHKIA